MFKTLKVVFYPYSLLFHDWVKGKMAIWYESLAICVGLFVVFSIVMYFCNGCKISSPHNRKSQYLLRLQLLIKTLFFQLYSTFYLWPRPVSLTAIFRLPIILTYFLYARLGFEGENCLLMNHWVYGRIFPS